MKRFDEGGQIACHRLEVRGLHDEVPVRELVRPVARARAHDARPAIGSPNDEEGWSSLTGTQHARWWATRRVRSNKPATYRCPFCGKSLHAMSDHTLIAPEGDGERRRHAHTECVLAAHQAGRLPTFDEWRTTQPSGTGRLSHLFRRV